MIKSTSLVCLVSSLFLLITAPSVMAQELDAQGKLKMDASGLAVGFEVDSSSGFDFYGVTINGNRVDLKDAVVTDDKMLEGKTALQVGGSLYQSLIRLSEPTTSSFKGRRVEVKVWYKSTGSAPTVALRWSSGDEERYIQRGDYTSLVALAYISFVPTGNATDDGWIELTSGPVDWMLGGTLPPDWISISDAQYIQSPFSRTPEYDPQARALIDGLQIIDLGPAVVPDTTCRGWQEQATCGDEGVCLLGRCSDARAVLGTVPDGELRRAYLTRLYEELNIFGAIRQGRLQLPTIKREFEALVDASIKTFWTDMPAAHERFIDGHGAPPLSEALNFYNTFGTCLGPGEADLLPDQTPGQLIPMVFDPGEVNALGLKQGDVITAIDGQPYDVWVEANARHFYNGNDVDGHGITNIFNLFRVAIKAGSVVTFSRCEKAEGCTAQDVQTITVDTAELLGKTFWNDEVPARFYAYKVCDLRFKAEVNRGQQEDFYSFARWADKDGVRHLVFNGFPSMYGSRQGANWRQAMDSGLNADVPAFVIDQRTGYGGQIDSLVLMVSHLLDVTNRARATFVPWFGEPFEGGLVDAVKQCLSLGQGSSELCGNYFDVEPTALLATGGGSKARLALVNGFDVSGNDYFARFLKFRQAPTRVFGYGPTVGAYGVSCQFPGHIGELRSMSYQCHDTLFSVGDAASVDGYESGYGVEPDELIYQKQSDALIGRDTIIEAATTWAAEQQQ